MLEARRLAEEGPKRIKLDVNSSLSGFSASCCNIEHAVKMIQPKTCNPQPESPKP